MANTVQLMLVRLAPNLNYSEEILHKFLEDVYGKDFFKLLKKQKVPDEVLKDMFEFSTSRRNIWSFLMSESALNRLREMNNKLSKKGLPLMFSLEGFETAGVLSFDSVVFHRMGTYVQCLFFKDTYVVSQRHTFSAKTTHKIRDLDDDGRIGYEEGMTILESMFEGNSMDLWLRVKPSTPADCQFYAFDGYDLEEGIEEYGLDLNLREKPRDDEDEDGESVLYDPH